eukprot:jgi/Ulvmu1/3437/UM016_0056.1
MCAVYTPGDQKQPRLDDRDQLISRGINARNVRCLPQQNIFRDYRSHPSHQPNIKSLPQYPDVPGARPPAQPPGPSCEPASCAAAGALTPPTPAPSASAVPSTPCGTQTLAHSPPAPLRPSGPADNAAPLGDAATADGTSEGPAAAAALVAAAISAVVASSEVKAAAADTAGAMDVDVPGEAAVGYSGARELGAAAAAAAAVAVKAAAPAGQCTVRCEHLPQVGPVATSPPRRLPEGRRGRAAAACARPLPPRSQRDPERGDLLVMLPCDTVVADVCVTCPVAPSRVVAAANTPGAAAQLMDDRKRDKYGRCGTGACRFVSLSHETFGRVDTGAFAFLNKIADFAAASGAVSRRAFLQNVMCELSTTLCRGVTRQVLAAAPLRMRLAGGAVVPGHDVPSDVL